MRGRLVLLMFKAFLLPILLQLCVCLQSKSLTKLKIRRIQSQPTNFTHALEILAETSLLDNDPTVVAEAIRVCGKCQRPDIALSTFQRYPSEPARTTAISVLGACDQHLEACKLIQQDYTHNSSAKYPVTSASYNAAIAACGRAKDWKRALKIHNDEIPRQEMTTLGTNALLTVLAQNRRGKEALDVLHGFTEHDGDRIPSRITYQIMINALVRSNMTGEAMEVLENLIMQNKNDDHRDIVEPTDAMFDMIIAAYNKRSDWESIRHVEQLRNPDGQIEIEDVQNKYAFQHWDKLERVGKGKGSYFVVGHILVPSTPSCRQKSLNITIGCQPHRNPSKNGIQLEFWENHDKGTEPTKLGFLLMINDGIKNTSSLLGMFLAKTDRGRGIAKVCLATWLWFCLKASITPVTGIINKPLLALALEYRFGFVPKKGGITIELAQSDGSDGQKGKLIVYSTSHKSIEGAFSPWDIANQNMLVIKKPPEPRGRKVSVRTRFSPPKDMQELHDKVKEILADGSVKCNLNTQDIQRLYFGKES